METYSLYVALTWEILFS